MDLHHLPKGLYIAALVSCACIIHRTAAAEEYPFTRLTVDNGLSNNQVTSICQDFQGLMWFATNDGVNCFDGYDLTIYKHDPQDTLTIQSNIVNRLYVDTAGTLWACTANGLARYDPLTDKFCRIAIQEDIRSVEDIIQLSSHLYLVMTRNLSLYYDDETGTVQEALVDGTPLRIYDIYSKGGTFIAATRGSTIEYLTVEGGRLVRKTAPLRIPRSAGVILDAGDGRCWAGLFRGGLCLVDLREGSVSDADDILGGTYQVGAMLHDSRGRLWIGGTEGIVIFDHQSDTRQQLHSERLDPHSLSHDCIKSLYMDSSGGIWAGTEYGGVNFCSDRPRIFNALKYSPESHPLSDNIVTAILPNQDGSLWIGTRHHGLTRYCPSDGSSFTIPDIDNIRAAYAPKDESVLYIGTNSGGWRIVSQDGASVKTIPRPTDVNAISAARGSAVWIGALTGLYLYEPDKGSYSKVTPPGSPGLLRVMAFLSDSKGHFWIGAKESLRVYEIEADNTLSDITPSSLDGIVRVQCIHEARDSVVWIGTADGLFRYDPSSDSFNLVSDVKSLGRITIKGIEEDGDGRLWISTDNGLNCYNPYTGECHTWYMEDGLQSNQFNSYSAHCKDSFGNLYFGGIGGVTWFSPSDIEKDPRTCPPILTSLLLFNTEVKPGDATGILSKDISLTDTITLKHDQNSITLIFSCPDYASGGRNTFTYKMDGMDKEWIRPSGREAVYSYLGRGSHTFRLRVANSDGTWCDTEKTLSIKVLPVWYETAAARICLALILLLCVLTALNKFKQRLDMLNKEKLDRMKQSYEEQVRQARMASLVASPYTLKQSDLAMLEQVLNIIDREITNPQFGVEGLAGAMSMTRSNLHLKISRITGMSPVQLIRKIRVEKACALIRTGRYTAAEVAEMAGFNSSSYFNKTFKKVVGCTPGEYSSRLQDGKMS